MAGNSTDEIVVGANGHVYVGPVGVTEPATIAAVWPAGWVDLGYMSEDGVTFTDAKTVENIPVWQLFYPARRIITARDLNVSFVMRQFSGDQVSLAFGGGDITEDAAGMYRFTPPEPEVIDERALGVEWFDGDKTYRLILKRGLVTEDVEANIVRAAATDLPISFGLIGSAGETPWYLLTDDPSFAESVGS